LINKIKFDVLEDPKKAGKFDLKRLEIKNG
jgi:hypothetical protein